MLLRKTLAVATTDLPTTATSPPRSKPPLMEGPSSPLAESVVLLAPKRRSSWTVLGKQISFIFLNYALSISINLFNTFLFSRHRRNLSLPVFAAAVYDAVQYLVALFAMFVLDGFRHSGIHEAYAKLTWRNFLILVLPCSIAAALDIALSNTSLRHIDLSLFTMIKSCSPVFVLMFAVCLGLERVSTVLVLIVAVIGVGVVLTLWDAVSFSWLGFSLAIAATVMAGARWALTQLVMDTQIAADHEGDDLNDDSILSKSDPLQTILYLTPTVTACLLLLSLAFEGPLAIWESEFFAWGPAAASSFGACTVGGILTFFLVLSQYKVVGETSVLTLSLLGIVKELLLIALSVLIFGDQLKPINIFGAGISIAGILMYQLHRLQSHIGIDSSYGHGGGEAVPNSPASSMASVGRKNRASVSLFVAAPTSDPTTPILIEPYAPAEANFNELWVHGVVAAPLKTHELDLEEGGIFELRSVPNGRSHQVQV